MHTHVYLADENYLKIYYTCEENFFSGYSNNRGCEFGAKYVIIFFFHGNSNLCWPIFSHKMKLKIIYEKSQYFSLNRFEMLHYHVHAQL